MMYAGHMRHDVGPLRGSFSANRTTERPQPKVNSSMSVQVGFFDEMFATDVADMLSQNSRRQI